MFGRKWLGGKLIYAMAGAMLLLGGVARADSGEPVETHGTAANYPLEITNIKPAGSGDPPIPASHRIFRAYPGIEYNIRAAVIGGLYPYSFALDGAPEGMTIDPHTGEISWPDPQEDSGEITLTVTDSEDTAVSTAWRIEVTTDGFLFVDASFEGEEETGSIGQPFISMASLLNNTDSSHVGDVVYFREGNYTWVEHNSGRDDSGRVDARMSLGGHPRQWLAYPGETVNMDADGRHIRMGSGGGYPLYLDGLNISNMVNWGFMGQGGMSYLTIRRCSWDGITSTTSVNHNQGVIMTHRSSPGYYGVIQDNVFTRFAGAQAIGSLYSMNKLLIENNCISEGGFRGPHSFATPVGIKALCHRYTIRGNRIIMPEEATRFDMFNSARAMRDEGIDDDAEFCFNLVVREGGGRGGAMGFYYPTHFHMYRNTFVGDVNFRTNLSTGPYSFIRNVLIGRLVNDEHVTSVGNIMADGPEGILDEEYGLAGEYERHIGTHGWQLEDGRTPIEARQAIEP